jgi:hypothetical protein
LEFRRKTLVLEVVNGSELSGRCRPSAKPRIRNPTWHHASRTDLPSGDVRTTSAILDMRKK